jgi:hypothetical protein
MMNRAILTLVDSTVSNPAILTLSSDACIAIMNRHYYVYIFFKPSDSVTTWPLHLHTANYLEMSNITLHDRLWRSWKTDRLGSVIAGVLKFPQCIQLEMVGPLSLFTCWLVWRWSSICWWMTASSRAVFVVHSDVCSYYISSCTRFLDIEIHNNNGGWQSCGVYDCESFAFASFQAWQFSRIGLFPLLKCHPCIFRSARDL